MTTAEFPGLCPASTPVSNSRFTSGFRLACTLNAGHPGEHQATGLDDTPIATWTDPEIQPCDVPGADDFCPATTPAHRGLACTLPANHAGAHIATGIGGHVLLEWEDPK